MTKLGKILAVVLFFTAVIFLGVTSAVVATSTPWLTYASDMTGYVFSSQGEGDSFQWTVAKRRSPDPAAPVGQTIKSSKVLPEVIIAARKIQLQEMQTSIQRLEQENPQLQANVQALKSAIESDLKALDARGVLLTEQLARIREELKAISDENLQMSGQITMVRAEEIARRKDVTRLKAVYEVVQTEMLRLESQQTALKDTLFRLQGTLDALDRRNGQLRHQLGMPPREEQEALPLELETPPTENET